jgi:hypothetical protein
MIDNYGVEILRSALAIVLTCFGSFLVREEGSTFSFIIQNATKSSHPAKSSCPLFMFSIFCFSIFFGDEQMSKNEANNGKKMSTA